MLNKDTLNFLTALELNNNREWFAANKDWYERARGDFERLVAQLICSIQVFDERVKHLEPKKCIFRIYKDTRFSKDKTPYKTHFGAILGSRESGYYLHVMPDGCFLASGIYQAFPEQLKRIRKEIYNDFEHLNEILNEPHFKKEIGDFYRDDDALKRVPNGFDKEHPAAEYLKLKHFYVMKSFDTELLLTQDFIKYSSQIYKLMMPLSLYLEEILNNQD